MTYTILAPTGATTATKRAIIYLRVSTDRQARRGGEAEGYSIPAQREACTKKAESLDASVIAEFVDAGESARSADRPELQALLKRLAPGDIDYVVVHKLDRLARDRMDDALIFQAVTKAGAKLISVSEAIDDTPQGMLMHGIMATMAEFYSRNLANETKKGSLEKAKRGGTPGRAPLGYIHTSRRMDGHEVKSIEADPDRARHITWAFRAYATGNWSIKSLTEELVRRGLRSRPTRTYAGGTLTPSQIHAMLSNPYYKGIVKYSGVHYDGNHPKLVDEVTWDQCQQVMVQRRLDGDRSWKRTHYLKGTLRCGRCGSRIGYGPSTNRRGDVYFYFFCLGRHTGRVKCDLPYQPVPKIEEMVEDVWARRIDFDESFIEEMRPVLLELLEESQQESHELIRQQEDRLTKLEHQKQKLIDAYLNDAIPVDALRERQKAVETEIANAQLLILNASTETSSIEAHLDKVLRLMRDAWRAYIEAPPAHRKNLNEAMFSKIDICLDDDETEPEVQLATELSEVVDATATALAAASAHVRRETALGRAKGRPGLANAATASDSGSGPRNRGENERTPGQLLLTRGSNMMRLVAGTGFEPVTSGL